MKKLLLLIIAILLMGCSNTKSLGIICNDDTEFIVRPPLDGQLICHNVKGYIDLIIINNGDTTIQHFNFTMTGSDGELKGTIKKQFRPGDIQLLNLHYNQKKLGNINRFLITPTIIYNGEPTECKTNKFVSYDIRECEG